MKLDTNKAQKPKARGARSAQRLDALDIGSALYGGLSRRHAARIRHEGPFRDEDETFVSATKGVRYGDDVADLFERSAGDPDLLIQLMAAAGHVSWSPAALPLLIQCAYLWNI